MQYILALDQGTTSSRAMLFDSNSAIKGSAQKEFAQIFPQPGWVEHDPMEIWDTQRSVAEAVMAEAKVTAADIAAIGIANQRETTIVWDRKSGAPVYNAIVWQDRRTAALCANLKAEGLEPLIQQKTGLVLDAYFSASKIAWILDNINDARTRAENGELAFGTVETWLLWKMTAGRKHITDPSNAARTMLLNISTGAWDEELLKIFNIPRAVLPELVQSSEIYAEYNSIPIAGMAGDQQAALFGQACHHPGMVKNTYGTGCFLLMHTGTEIVTSRHKLLATIAWKINGVTEYALEGSVFSGGAVVQWLRDGLGIIKTAAESERLAASVADNGGVYVVPAFVGLGAPHWDPYARGNISGLTRGTNSGHIARAALESIAFQVKDVLDAMQLDSEVAIKELRGDGGAAVNNLLMQFQADMLNVPVVRSLTSETTALGAAYLAGLAVGYWKNIDEISNQWQEQRRFLPSMQETTRSELLKGWRRALERAKG